MAVILAKQNGASVESYVITNAALHKHMTEIS